MNTSDENTNDTGYPVPGLDYKERPLEYWTIEAVRKETGRRCAEWSWIEALATIRALGQELEANRHYLQEVVYRMAEDEQRLWYAYCLLEEKLSADEP